jgi:glycolate oxidase FAD binding subunit
VSLNVSPPAKAARSRIQSDLQQIVGELHVSSGVAPETEGRLPAVWVEPGSETEMAAVLAYANENGLRVTPRGGGTKTCWGNSPLKTHLILSTLRLNRIVEYGWADLTATVEAGCTVAALQQALAEHGQRVAVDPLWPERATVGGVLSTNDSGALRLGFGGLRDLIIGATICLPDGTLARSGGKVVKNVAGYDLPKLVTGALGTLGVITRAVFRLHPKPQSTRTLSITLGTAEEIRRLLQTVRNSKLTPAALQIRLASDSASQAEILFEGTSASVSYQSDRFCGLMGDTPIREHPSPVWNSREELWAHPGDHMIAKLSVLPSEITRISVAVENNVGEPMAWRLLWYATGIGWLRIDGPSSHIQTAMRNLRKIVEEQDGSLVIARQPAGSSLDAWGEIGAVGDVMRAVKNQFDPRGTLNAGRFAAGI